MEIIKDYSYIESDLPPSLEIAIGTLLRLRVRQLDPDGQKKLDKFAHFLIAEPGDSIAALDAELSFSLLQNVVDASRYGDPEFEPSWEWIENHGGFFELAYILTDDGFAHIVFVLDREGVDADLLSMCRHYTAGAPERTT